ncbi:MAG: hypothetical protein Q9221_005013 [Calogaya cf. arnoldii]
MDNLVDPSTADITSRMLELCTVIIRHAQSTHGRPPAFIVQRAQQAVPGIIRFLANKQESDGSWWCRWAVNYVRQSVIHIPLDSRVCVRDMILRLPHGHMYLEFVKTMLEKILGTSLAISALSPYIEHDGRGPVAKMIQQGVAFIKTLQHSDGGWGETVASYDLPAPPKGQGPSLPSSTGWALMGLLGAGLDPMEPVIQQGVSWLVREQTDLDGSGGASWPERQFTGVGFPGRVYLGYGFYRHYFPMLALGKYMSAPKKAFNGEDGKTVLPY